MSVLAGIRVVEMGIWVAGPAAGGILADWGAEVVKVEPPKGDPMRRLYSALSQSKESRCPPFDLFNRGKRSVAVDVNDEAGRRVVEELIASADVFLTNMRPAFLQRTGLDHETLLAKYPRLVYGSLTAYGLEGPDRDAPGYDVGAFSARSGLADRSKPVGDPPPNLPGALGDNITGITLVAAILAGLLHRERNGEGQLVATSLLRAGIYCIGMDLAARLDLERLAPPPSRKSPQNPLMNSYAASDGRWFWLLGAESERHWPSLLAAVDDPELGRDERFATPRDRRRNSPALVTRLEEIFATRTREAWKETFAEVGVWWSPVNTVEDLLLDEQVLSSGAFTEVVERSAESERGARRAVATPVDFGHRRPLPLPGVAEIGEDSAVLLRELGFTDEEMARMVATGTLAFAGTMPDPAGSCRPSPSGGPRQAR